MSDLTTESASMAAQEASPSIDSGKIVTSVAQTVQSHPDVHPSKAAGIIAAVLGGLYQAEPAIFAISRVSPRTQAEVSLGVGLAEVILGAFLHPAG